MKEHSTTQEHRVRPDLDRPPTTEKLTPEQKKTVYKLAEHIDEYGRYSDAMKLIAVGFAAGRGMTEHEARQEIEQHFKMELGQDMKSYLEKHRLDRGMRVDAGRKR